MRSNIETAEAIVGIMRALRDGSMDVRVDAVSHIRLASKEWRYIAVYLASQTATARSQSDAQAVVDSRLALHNIESAVRNWREAEARRHDG